MGIMDLFRKRKQPQSPFHITNGVLYRYHSFVSDETEITVPDGVLDIAGLAFESCSRLTRIVLPRTVHSVGSRAFAGCKSLKEVILPDSISVIGEEAFVHCTALKEIRLPQALKTLGDGAFSGCLALTRVDCPDGLTQIPKKAFAGCVRLQEITLPRKLHGIQTAAFLGCKALSQITLPDSLRILWARAFAGCTGLTEMTLPESLTDAEPDSMQYLETLHYLHRAGTLSLTGFSEYAGDVLHFLRHPSTSQLEWMLEHCPRELVMEMTLRLYPQYAVFGEYFAQRGGAFGTYLIEQERTEELIAFCESGLANDAAFDEMIEAAIAHTQQSGSAEMQMLLMRYRQTAFGEAEQPTFFL